MVGGKLAQIFKSIFFGWFLSFGGKKMKTLSAKPDPEDLEFVAKLLDEGNIKAIIHKRSPLDKAAEAMDYFSKGHSPGKPLGRLPETGHRCHNRPTVARRSRQPHAAATPLLLYTRIANRE